MSRVGHIGAVAWGGAFTGRRALVAAGTGGLVLSGLAFAIVLTSDQPGDRPLIAFGRVLVIAVPIAVGIWLWSRLARRLRDDPYVSLPVVIGEAVADPSLEVAYWMPGPPAQWIDEAGRSVALPGKDSARSTTEVRGRDGPMALLIPDRALDDQKEFLEAVGSIAVATLEDRRLTAQVDASLEELHESRARIQALRRMPNGSAWSVTSTTGLSSDSSNRHREREPACSV